MLYFIDQVPSMLEQTENEPVLPPMPDDLPLPARSPAGESSFGDAADLFDADLPSVSSVGSLADRVVSGNKFIFLCQL